MAELFTRPLLPRLTGAVRASAALMIHLALLFYIMLLRICQWRKSGKKWGLSHPRGRPEARRSGYCSWTVSVPASGE